MQRKRLCKSARSRAYTDQNYTKQPLIHSRYIRQEGNTLQRDHPCQDRAQQRASDQAVQHAAQFYCKDPGQNPARSREYSQQDPPVAAALFQRGEKPSRRGGRRASEDHPARSQIQPRKQAVDKGAGRAGGQNPDQHLPVFCSDRQGRNQESDVHTGSQSREKAGARVHLISPPAFHQAHSESQNQEKDRNCFHPGGEHGKSLSPDPGGRRCHQVRKMFQYIPDHILSPNSFFTAAGSSGHYTTSSVSVQSYPAAAPAENEISLPIPRQGFPHGKAPVSGKASRTLRPPSEAVYACLPPRSCPLQSRRSGPLRVRWTDGARSRRKFSPS